MDWRKNWKVSIVAGVIIVITAVIIILSLAKRETVSMVLICEDTGTVFMKKVPVVGVYFPIKCADSVKETAYPAGKYQCPICGKTFTLPLKGQTIEGKRDAIPPEEMGPRMGYKCPDDSTPLNYMGREWKISK